VELVKYTYPSLDDEREELVVWYPNEGTGNKDAKHRLQAWANRNPEGVRSLLIEPRTHVEPELPTADVATGKTHKSKPDPEETGQDGEIEVRREIVDLDRITQQTVCDILNGANDLTGRPLKRLYVTVHVPAEPNDNGEDDFTEGLDDLE